MGDSECDRLGVRVRDGDGLAVGDAVSVGSSVLEDDAVTVSSIDRVRDLEAWAVLLGVPVLRVTVSCADSESEIVIDFE